MSRRLSSWRAGLRTRRFHAPILALTVLIISAGSTGCAARGFRPPGGVGEPAPEAARALDEAVDRCRGVRSFAASTRLSGRVGGEALGSFGLDVGLTADGEMLLEVRALNTTRLWLSGRRGRATLYLADEHVALTEPAEQIVEALIGVRLAPDQLLALMTGCVARDLTMNGAERFGDVLKVTTPDGALYLERRTGRWRIVAGSIDGLFVSYTALGLSFPEEFRVLSEAGGTAEVDIRLRIVQGRSVNSEIAPAAFTRQIPAGAGRITLEDLRAAGPLRAGGGA